MGAKTYQAATPSEGDTERTQAEDENLRAGLFEVEWMAKHYPDRFHGLSNPKGIFNGTREEWLEAAAIIMGGWLNYSLTTTQVLSLYRGKAKRKVVPVSFLKHLVDTYGGRPSEYQFNPSKVRYSCSLQGAGLSQGKALAHVHYAQSTGNSYHEIRMGVQLGGRKLKGDSARVADVLLHEMIHTCATRAGHGGAFKQIAQNIGLRGKMTATVASDALRARIWDDVVSVLGRYPHKKVHLTPRGERGKGSRLKKAECLACGFNFRTTEKWIRANMESFADLRGVDVSEVKTPCFKCPTCMHSAPNMVVQGYPMGGEEE
jgi:hypothetical protein